MTMFLKRFYIYQKTRFPFVLLIMSLLPATLSTAAVTIGRPSILQVFGALIASVLYLLHIRIIDEIRDLYHDNKHHRLRPLQVGIISSKELRVVDNFAIVILLAISIINNTYSFDILAGMLLYTYVASKDFFMGNKLRQHFFIYNGVNIVQMLFLQLFAYAFYAGIIKFNLVLITHYIFTSTGTIIFEFVRKLKYPGEDGTGKDTYTYYMGFDKAIFIYIELVILNSLLFYLLTTFIVNNNIYWLFLSIFLFLISLVFTVIHWIKKTIISEQLMQLAFLIIYAIFNLIIYKIN